MKKPKKGRNKGMDLGFMIGQRLCAGFPGLEMDDDFREKMKRHRIGNVILFAHNIGTREQVRALCADIQGLVMGATGQPAFIFIDQEGGVVSRLREDCTLMPSAMGVAATGDPGLAYEAGRITGRELHALGINFNLAPVMDLNSNPQNPVIGVRSYGESPEAAIPYMLEMAAGLKAGGVHACAKHFPGHGDTAVDSHLGLPRVDKGLEELEAMELKPFRAAIAAGIPAVMSSHILFPRLEPAMLPATMSRAVMTGLLRERLGFKGLVLSDCMMMRAIADHFGSLDGILAALGAGVDLVFTSHSVDLAAQAAQMLTDAWDNKLLDAGQMAESVQRILGMKAALKPAPAEGLDLVGCPEHRQAADRMFERALTAVRLPEGGIPDLGARPLFIGCKAYVPTLASSPQPAGYAFSAELQARFGGTALDMPENPTDADIARLLEAVPGHTSVVVGTYNGHLRPGQLRLVQALSDRHGRVICVALRNPYDLKDLPEKVTAIAAYTYNRASLRALIKLLAGDIQASGRLPVSLQ